MCNRLIEQYATTSVSENKDVLSPAAIIEVAGDNDIVKAIHYARENNLALAEQEVINAFGMSSTSGDNVQLDLGNAYLYFDCARLD